MRRRVGGGGWVEGAGGRRALRGGSGTLLCCRTRCSHPVRHTAIFIFSYHCNLNILLGKLRGGGGAIKWADVGALKAELEAQVQLPPSCTAAAVSVAVAAGLPAAAAATAACCIPVLQRLPALYACLHALHATPCHARTACLQAAAPDAFYSLSTTTGPPGLAAPAWVPQFSLKSEAPARPAPLARLPPANTAAERSAAFEPLPPLSAAAAGRFCMGDAAGTAAGAALLLLLLLVAREPGSR